MGLGFDRGSVGLSESGSLSSFSSPDDFDPFTSYSTSAVADLASSVMLMMEEECSSRPHMSLPSSFGGDSSGRDEESHQEELSLSFSDDDGESSTSSSSIVTRIPSAAQGLDFGSAALPVGLPLGEESAVGATDPAAGHSTAPSSLASEGSPARGAQLSKSKQSNRSKKFGRTSHLIDATRRNTAGSAATATAASGGLGDLARRSMLSITSPTAPKSPSGSVVPPEPPPAMDPQVLTAGAARKAIRESYASDKSANLDDYQTLFHSQEDSSSMLLKVATFVEPPLPEELEGITIERLVFSAAMTTPRAEAAHSPVLLLLKTEELPETLTLANCLSGITLFDTVLVSLRNVISLEELCEMLPILIEIPPCRDRVLTFVSLWIEVFSEDFQRKSLYQLMEHFLLRLVSTHSSDLSLLTRLAECSVLPSLPSPPKNLPPHSDAWTTMPTRSLAEAITLLDTKLFKRILPSELLVWPYLSRDEKQEKAPNISAMVDQFNFWHFFAATHVLLFKEAQQRCKAIIEVLSLTVALKKLNNISATTAVFSALLSTPISRLKVTWSLLPTKYQKIFSNFSRFISSQKNFGEIRRHLNSTMLPSLPHMGVLMQDITFIRENPDFLSYQDQETDLFNMKKALLTTKTIVALQFFQCSNYVFKSTPSEETLHLLRTNLVLKNEALHKRSEQLEPRTNK